MPVRGGSRGRKKQTLRDFTRELPSQKDRERFNEAMNSPSDLVTAIIHAIELDFIIEQSIVANLPRQDDDTIALLAKENGPLSTFFSKIVLGYAMAVYDAERMEYLHTVRRIRNAFAHARKEISFATPLIRDELASLKLPEDTTSELYTNIALVKRLASLPGEGTGAAPHSNAALTTRLRTEKGKPAIVALSGRAAYVIVCMTLVRDLITTQASAVRERHERFRRSVGADAPTSETVAKVMNESE